MTSLWAKVAMWMTEKIQEFAGRYDSVSHLYPPFEAQIDALLLAAHEAGLDVGLHQGFRSWEEQDRLYAKGRTTPGPKVTNAKGGESWHNYGLAADIVFRVKGKWSWTESHPWDQLGALGKELGLEWGGDWTRLRDRPHFEWPDKMSLKAARLLHQRGGLKEVWKNLEGEKS